MDKVHTYKDYIITLEAQKQESGWKCKYVVRPLDPRDTRSHSGYTTIKCETEEKAEELALGTALHWVDSSTSPEGVSSNP